MVNVVLVDDHRIIREGLKSLLSTLPDTNVIGEASSGLEALALLGKLTPDIVVLDVAMRGLNGIQVAQEIRTKFPSIKVIALSMHDDKRFVTKMLEAGVRGYVLKEGAFSDLSKALDTVAQGKIYLSPDISSLIAADYANHPTEATAAKISGSLTQRERSVLQLIAEGNSTQEIANSLSLSVKTIETHRRNIMGKLDLFSVADLTKYAIREGLTQL